MGAADVVQNGWTPDALRDLRLSTGDPPRPAYYDSEGRACEAWFPMGPRKRFAPIGCVHVFAGSELVETRMLVLSPGGAA